MPKSQRSHPPTGVKPEKPYPDFPLYAHRAGVWAKKIRGKTYYFGRWDDPDGALAKYLAEKDQLQTGLTPRPAPGEFTVKELVNHFLYTKEARVSSGELSPRTWADYKATAALLISEFGEQRLVIDLHPDDFAALRKRLTEQWGDVRVGNVIQYVRCIFGYGYDAGLIDRPTRFGPEFIRPSKKTMRKHRADKGPKLFTPQQLRAMIRKASQPLKAMLLLGINCGFGNADCGTLPMTAVDLAGGWIDYPRPKSGVPRRCPLWPETVAALREALEGRPSPKHKADAGLLFITKYGLSWAKETADNPISKEMAKLLQALKLYRGRGLSFSAVRQVFATVGGEAKDQVAVDHILGHAREDTTPIDRERISDERLQAVSNHVRGWLFGV